MTFKELLSLTWQSYLEMNWTRDKVFSQDASKNDFIEPRLCWNWSTTGKKSPFRERRAIGWGRRAFEALSLRGWTKTQALSTRKDRGLSSKRAALRERVIKDKEENLPGKLDCGHSYFSFKNGTAINFSDVQVENQPTQFHNSLIQRKTKKMDPQKRISLLHECSMVTWRDLPIYGTPLWYVIVNTTSTTGVEFMKAQIWGFEIRQKGFGSATLQLWHGVFMTQEWAYCFSKALKTSTEYIFHQPKVNKRGKNGSQDCKIRKEEKEKEEENKRTERMAINPEVQGLLRRCAGGHSCQHSWHQHFIEMCSKSEYLS